MTRRDHVRRTARKNYRAKSYTNPFFKKKTTVPWRGIFVAGLAIGVVLFGTITLLSNERFSINNVDITGLEHISNTDLEAVVMDYLDEPALLFFERSNAFLFNRDDLITQISELFTFADVEVSTQSTTLFLSIAERTSNLVWQTGERAYIVDLEGIVVREVFLMELNELNPDTYLKGLPLFRDINNLDVEIGGTVLTPNEVKGAFGFQEHLINQSIRMRETQIDRLAGKWVSVLTEDGYSILFDPTGDIDEQALRLLTLMSTEIQEEQELEYIDLRFGDHVYFR
jgi:cell division septal protein FtsQ